MWAHAIACMWKSEDNLWESVLCFYYVVLGLKLRSSDLAAAALSLYLLSHLVSSTLILATRSHLF